MKHNLTVLVAPNAFKESLSAAEAARSIAEGIRKGIPGVRIIKVPIADGGDGTLEVLIRGTHGKIFQTRVINPLGKGINSSYGITGDGKTAFIEMSRASGLALVPLRKRNPWFTTSYGTGQLVQAALRHQVDQIILTIGGSATVDGGLGALRALGANFTDRHGNPIPLGGRGLQQLEAIHLENLDPALRRTRLVVACDVDNPLVGPRGAAAVFGPQKGATGPMVKQLDKGLAKLARKIYELKKIDISAIPGAGAAGGISGAFLGLLGARLLPGSDLVFGLLKLEDVLQQVDFVITGEGKIDSQTPAGKGPGMLAKLARRHGVPLIAIAGSVSDDVRILHRHGFSALFGIVQGPIDLRSAKHEAARLLKGKSEQIARLIHMTRCLSQ